MVWAGALAGVVVKLWRVDLHVISGFMYIGLGWVAVVTFPAIARSLDVPGTILLVTGGLDLLAGGAGAGDALAREGRRDLRLPRGVAHHDGPGGGLSLRGDPAGGHGALTPAHDETGAQDRSQDRSQDHDEPADTTGRQRDAAGGDWDDRSDEGAIRPRDRGGVAADPHARAVPHPAREGHRTGRDGGVRVHERPRRRIGAPAAAPSSSDSETKFESGTGWPSFFQPIRDGAIVLRTDRASG